MDIRHLEKISDVEWRIKQTGAMRVPGILFADETLLLQMDEKVCDQIMHVAALPGIVKASFAMPDAHWGYGFPIGGVAAFDASNEGVVCAGGVGFDISCGIRTMLTGMTAAEFAPYKEKIANALFHSIPAGVGSTGAIRLTPKEMDEMLLEGASWAVKRGFGTPSDLKRIESHGTAAHADPDAVSERAKKRQEDEMGTLGSGNHYLEIQEITDIFDEEIAAAYGLKKHELVITIHCGSRGLGHQIATEYSQRMLKASHEQGIILADRELACAPIHSSTGQAYLGAMRSAINCALANRQILSHLVRQTFHSILPHVQLPLLYDVSHNTCLEEEHIVDGTKRTLFVHRKGATRAFGPDHPELDLSIRPYGQPVLIGGSMGTSSYILAGTKESSLLAFSSACHGAGRQMSRTQALKQWGGREVIDDLSSKGILICCKSYRGIAEEAPLAYKNVNEVVEATHTAGLAKKIAILRPIVCVKG